MKKQVPFALTALALLGGCHIFKKEATKTAVVGERIPVLTSESDVAADPALADMAVTIPDAVENKDWGQPGGNTAKNIGNVALGLALEHVWTAEVPGTKPKARLAAAPAIGDGRVYVIDTRAAVHAFQATTGQRLWTAQLGEVEKRYRPSLFGGGVSFAEGKLYAPDGIGDAAALDPATGKILWKKRPGGPLRGAPSVGLGNVYVLSSDNQIFALKSDTGETAWTEAATLQTAGVFGVGAPAIAQGTVVAGFSSGELTAYRYENGRSVWQDALSRTSITTSVSSLSDIDASPVIEGGKVYAVGIGGRMVALDLISGQRQWELNIAGIDTPAVAGDWLFVVTDEAKLLCIQRTTGRVRWLTQLPRWKKEKKKTGAIQWAGPLLAGGRLIVANSQGYLVNVNVETGRIGTGTRASKGISFPPVVAGKMLYLLDDKGRLSAYR